MLTANLIWAYIRKYWKLILIGILIIACYIIFKKRVVDFTEDFIKVNESHNKEIEEIKAARKEQMEKRAVAREVYKNTMTSIEEEYRKDNEKIEKAKKKEVTRILKKFDGDPDKLAEELRTVTNKNIKVIMPL